MFDADQELVFQAEQAVFAAAQHLLCSIAQRRDLQTELKEDATIVTVLDVESQNIILQRLGKLLPVVTEEDPSTHSLLDNEDFFLVDPLDGTTACRRFSHLPAGQVGFGPLVGICRRGRLWACVYANIPSATLYSAVRGQGAYSIPLRDWSRSIGFNSRTRLRVSGQVDLNRSAVLFFPGRNGELDAAQRLRAGLGLETMYRFGGFANDCTRVARGFEEMIVQFSLKAWDYSATLIASEAGLSVLVNPMEDGIIGSDYRIEPRCQVLVVPELYSQAALDALRL